MRVNNTPSLSLATETCTGPNEKSTSSEKGVCV